MSTSNYTLIAQGIETILAGLSIAGSPQTLLSKFPSDRTAAGVALPSQQVTIGPAAERAVGALNSANDWEYPYLLTFMKACNQDFTWDSAWLTWRRQIQAAFHGKRPLSSLTLNPLFTVDPSVVTDPSMIHDDHLNIGQLLVWARTRENRISPPADYAASFNGTNQYLSAASNSTLQTGGQSFSVAFWFRTTANSQQIAGKSIWSGDGEWVFQTDNNNKLEFATIGAPPVPIAVSPTAVCDGNWHFVVGVQDIANNRIGLSIDNAPLVYRAITHASISTTDPLVIGASITPDHYFNGAVGDVGFWNGHVLSATEITALYNSGKGLKAIQLSGNGVRTPTSWWDLSELSGTRLDSFGSNNLTSNNGVGAVAGVSSHLPDGNAIYASVGEAVQTAIQAIGLVGIASGQVGLLKTWADRLTVSVNLQNGPAILVATSKTPEKEVGPMIGKDDYYWPCLVTHLKASNQSLAWDDSWYLARQQIRDAFHNQLLPAIGTALWCEVEPRAIVDPSVWHDQNADMGQLLIKVRTREDRT